MGTTELTINVASTQDALDLIPIDLGGGCSLSKADAMFYLINKFAIKESVDIGVYRGRSLLPQALAHKLHTGGCVYGVDPYDNELVREKDNHELKELIDDFVDNNDFGVIYQDVLDVLSQTGLSENATILRMTSASAAEYFIEHQMKPRLIHIDGNHDLKMVVDDVVKYCDILGENGFIVMDDISWRSVKPAVDILENKKYTLLFSHVDTMNDYAIFTNISSFKKNKKLASELFKFGQY